MIVNGGRRALTASPSMNHLRVLSEISKMRGQEEAERSGGKNLPLRRRQSYPVQLRSHKLYTRSEKHPIR